ncbi:hypothetical protein AM500_10695 [Bacillus sp. FJAT-18017]|uniref:signal peptidase I n=1 Tax=Bacillus sp. FJAT-18017 TaxID=1705566 RepID=UPI0006AF8AFE|nr:signal peptidase I [Bacillus sp. FJAT-18017]ALC90199.1 hypothetical protein AM500_10695 [Bacillus sp. FJAT-18017]
MKVFKIISRILSSIIVVCLVIAAILAISSRLSGGTPKFFGKTMMMVLSGSMEPKIHTGSVVFVEDIKDPSLLKVGDVITFKSPVVKDRIITHRIKEIKNTGNLEFVTKGDNNTSDDPLTVPQQNLLGKYSNITVPYLGYIMSFLQSKKGLGISLIIPGGLLIILEMFTIWRTLASLDKPKKEQAIPN